LRKEEGVWFLDAQRPPTEEVGWVERGLAVDAPFELDACGIAVVTLFRP
jgi:hypothetical protein